MKNRILILLLVLCLLVCLLPVGQNASAANTCFIAINDELLPLGSAPYISGGTIYVAPSILSYFGVYSSSFPQDNTLLLYNASTQLFFDLNSGTSYDGAGNTYSTGALSSGYVPVNFVGSFFGGFVASYISGNSYGDIVRITNGGQVLSDQVFLSAVSDLMRNYYNTYYGIAPTPSGEPTPSPTPDRIDAKLSLYFIGLPADSILETLNSSGLKACFFVTESEVRNAPAEIRSLVVQGHSIGLYCSTAPAESYAAAMPVLYECIRELPLLLCSSPECQEETAAFAAGNGLVHCTFNLMPDSETTPASFEAALRLTDDDLRIGFNLYENTDSLVETLAALLTETGITTKAPNEIQ